MFTALLAKNNFLTAPRSFSRQGALSRRIPLLVILFLALGLRLYRLDVKGL